MTKLKDILISEENIKTLLFSICKGDEYKKIIDKYTRFAYKTEEDKVAALLTFAREAFFEFGAASCMLWLNSESQLTLTAEEIDYLESLSPQPFDKRK